MKKIAYQDVDGNLNIITPVLVDILIEDVARRDVPEGIPYKILEDSDLPTDRTFRNAWELDFTNPDGYGDS
jgi:hypothetical protein